MKQKKILVVSFQSLMKDNAAGMGRLGYFVSERLHQHNMLQYFVVHSKGKFDTSFPSRPVSWLSRYYLYALNKLDRIFHFPSYWFRLVQEVIFDWFCAYHLNDSVSILFTTHGHMKRTFKKARSRNIRIIYVPANPEDNYIYKLVTEEKALLGITNTDAYTYLPRLNFYNQAMKHVHEVIGTYPTVYRSYKNADVPCKVVQIDGHLNPDFHPVVLKDKEITPEFRVGYLAHTVVLKGLQYLLEAWEAIQQTNPDTRLQLYVAGGMNPELKAYVDSRFGSLANVTYHGYVESVPDFMQSLDLFVVPSLIDGGPYTAVEAAHYAVPVIITENCGSGELLGRNESGCWIVPIRDSAAIKHSILSAYADRVNTKKVGMNAKHNLDSYNMDELINEVATYLLTIQKGPVNTKDPLAISP